ncbi:MAG: hypothetical protein WCF30_19135 [Terracidiphilus sp.]
MTIAEAVNNAIEANPDGDNWEVMEDVSKSLFDQHRTMNDNGDIVAFEDGSFYSFDPNIMDEDANPVFSSRADLMEAIDAYNYALDYTNSRCPVEEYSGMVRDSGDRIDTLELTNIVDATGKRVEFVSTERYDEEEDSCYIEYRTDLAAAIGKRVRITAREDTQERAARDWQDGDGIYIAIFSGLPAHTFAIFAARSSPSSAFT